MSRRNATPNNSQWIPYDLRERILANLRVRAPLRQKRFRERESGPLRVRRSESAATSALLHGSQERVRSKRARLRLL